MKSLATLVTTNYTESNLTKNKSTIACSITYNVAKITHQAIYSYIVCYKYSYTPIGPYSLIRNIYK